MPFLLIVFLAIALIVTITGAILTPKAQAGRGYSIAGSPGLRTGYPSAVPLRARRYGEEARRSVQGTGFWTPSLFDRLLGRRAPGSTPWTAVTVGLVSIFLLGLYVFVNLLPSHPLLGYFQFSGNTSATSSSSSSQNSPEPNYGASKALLRLSQLDPGQYDTSAQYNTWAYSACSTAAMTEVINAYGHHYRVIDILKVEASLGEITPASGLLRDSGIAHTVAQFGFQTTWGYNLSLDQVINIANHGRPVIVSWPPDRYAGGHLVVVTGGDAHSVYLADSSIYNRHSLSRAQFMQWWEGFSAIVTPK